MSIDKPGFKHVAEGFCHPPAVWRRSKMVRRPSRLASPVLRFLSFILVLGCVLSSPSQIWAKGCAESLGPAVPPPASLWGDMQPGSILVDATTWTGSQLPNTRYQISTAVDIENGWVFQSFYGGFSIWDARTNPATPTRTSIIGGWERNFPSWPSLTEFTQIVFYIDAPEGNDNLVAVAAITPVGITLWDTTTKTAPKALYQDTGKFSYQVYAARIGTRDYAFAADFLGDPGLHVYDMTTAKSFNSCIENRTNGEVNCPGVYQTRVGPREATKYVAGLGVGTRHFVAKSGGSGTGTGIRLYDVTNPSQPQLVVQDFQGFNQFGDTHGMAMWTQNGEHYLAARQSKGTTDIGKIFNITSCLTTGCAGLQNLEVWRSGALKPYPESTYWLSAVFSRSGSTPFIYFGNHDTCRQGEAPYQTEYLMDVSNPAAPRDVSPQVHGTDLGVPVDYWSWYYSDTTRGWSHMGPRVAKFNGEYLYRAAATIFDVHKWTGALAGPPTANFTWSPDVIYSGDPVSFTSTSTGSPTSFSWTFQDGAPSSASGSSAQSAFTSPGVKPVSLTVGNQQGQDSEAKNVVVLDPAPMVSGITTIPANPLVCQPVTLKAENVTGKAPLIFEWKANQITVPGNATQVTWSTTGLGSGTYPINLKISRAGSPDATASTSVTLGPLVPLPAQGAFAPTNDTFSAGTVQFHVTVPGATEWMWDFGDGTTPVWTSDPVTGPNPSHSYTQTGTYAVKVSVRNCVEGGPLGIASLNLSVPVTSVAPLVINLFQAQGCQIFCDFAPGQAITFASDVSGSPTQYEYDWSGNGFGGANAADDQTSATPVTSHTYAAQGTYTPTLRIRRGTEVSIPWVHLAINVRTVTNPPPPPPGPSVTVTGPSSGQTNAAISFTATASNCTPGTWTWNGGSGATVTSNGSSAQITWSSAGSKTVQATASGCATGTKTINISDPNTGGLTANFTFSPASPGVNQAVSFDASSSTGAPSLYFWEFPGGATAFGATVSRTFTAAGSQAVKLTVYKDCGAGGVCSSQASTTKTVVVTGGPPPLVASFDTSATCASDIVGVRCEAQTGQAITLTSTSTGNPTTFAWSFNDGTPAGSGAQVSHTFAAPGSFLVQLTVGNGQTTVSTTRLFVITGSPSVVASFNTSATCTGSECAAETGQAVTFTSTGTGGTSFSWSFGDGTAAASGAQVSHTFATAGRFTVQLTASNGFASANASRVLVVTDPPVAQSRSVVLPWIAQTRGALVQSSDLYVNNPGDTAMDVTLEFRKRGAPETTPPQATRTIQPGATLYVGDVLRELFNRENVAGFITVKVNSGDAEPVITSFNTTFQADGKQFGQTVSGISMSSAGSATGSGPDNRMQHLVGLIDNTERLAYFGLSNPSDQPATYHLRFYDKAGHMIGESAEDLTLSRFGQRQFQVREIEEFFGVSNVADYRIEIENRSTGMLVPYASNLRLVSEDPSFIGAGSSKTRSRT